MALYDSIAELPLVIDAYALDGLERSFPNGWVRRTTVVTLSGAGETGVGEDVSWSEDDQLSHQERGPELALAGSWTIASFSAHLAGLDLFGGRAPEHAVYRDYRTWAYESAALDLALRQAGRSFADVVGREPRPLRFVVSCPLGDPPGFEPVARRLEAYPGMGFKLDATPAWTPELIDRLAGTRAVAVIDFKGRYRGTSVDVETDPELYARVAAALPDALLEDPDLDPPDARAALAGDMDRVTWDAPIHSVDDVLGLEHAPRTLNVKPSRFGTWRRLLDFYDLCAERGIALYGGGQSELGPGRGQIQLLAALFHPDAPNDVAPRGHDWADFPPGLPTSPLDPRPEAAGFRRRP